MVGQKVPLKLENLVLPVTSVPVSEPEEREERGKDDMDADNHTFIGVTGLILAIFGYVGFYR